MRLPRPGRRAAPPHAEPAAAPTTPAPVTAGAVAAALRALFRDAGVRIDPLLRVDRAGETSRLHVGDDLLLQALPEGGWELAGPDGGEPVRLAPGTSARDVAAAVMAAAIAAWD